MIPKRLAGVLAAISLRVGVKGGLFIETIFFHNSGKVAEAAPSPPVTGFTFFEN
jgi:hypothetical protein